MTTINNQDDFLQALDDNPQWRAAVRARILGDELLQLPAKFDAFVQRVEGFIEQQTEFNKRAVAREMAYCIHCLTPMNPWNSKLEEKGAGYPMEHAESRSWLLYRALEGRYVSPGNIEDRKTHICEEECLSAKNHSVKNNPILKHPEAICWKAFQEPYVARALFCPT